MRQAAAALAVVAGFFGAGCSSFDTKYDNDVASCTVANGRVELVLTASRDSSFTDNDLVPEAYLRACAILRAAVPEGRR